MSSQRLVKRGLSLLSNRLSYYQLLTLCLRMQIDIEHFRAKLGKIDGASPLGDKLLELVQSKSVAAALFDAEGDQAAEEQAPKDTSES